MSAEFPEPPMAADRCTLDDRSLASQLDRYRRLGRTAVSIESSEQGSGSRSRRTLTWTSCARRSLSSANAAASSQSATAPPSVACPSRSTIPVQVRCGRCSRRCETGPRRRRIAD